MTKLRILSILIITGLVSFTLANPSHPGPGRQRRLCNQYTLLGRIYQLIICFTSPADGSTLTGAVPVSVSVTITGSTSGVQHMLYFLNGTYLLTSYTKPWGFMLPTSKWADGNYTLAVSALMPNSFTTAKAQIAVTFSNGNATTPVNTSTFTPSSGNPPAGGQPFVVAAGGDGASGEKNSTNVVNLLTSLNPNLFLYLGDVYESGSMAEFYNWYGTASSNFGLLRAITDPTIGNHEYTNGVGGAGYFDYWNNIPNYYSFNAGGWHFISLNSNSSKIKVSSTLTTVHMAAAGPGCQCPDLYHRLLPPTTIQYRPGGSHHCHVGHLGAAGTIQGSHRA